MHWNVSLSLAVAALAGTLALPSWGQKGPPSARSASAGGLDPMLLSGLAARSIGPAAMSGRVAAIDAFPGNPDIVWVGTASGGVWKSANAGLTWTPVFDDQPVASIGAVAIDPTNPDVVWVGTGEGNPRNSVSIGEGIFKTLDGGKTWKRLGLEKTERIHRILLDPKNPQVAYVAALGRAWGENPERGVYKTEDGGATWKRVLYVDERTGCADLAIDPGNPRKLFAAMWDYRRWPWSFRSGGPGSGLFVTYDGGQSWKRLTEDDGLPAGDLGRIGISISRSNPKIVYALVEAKKPALVRSEDGGLTWDAVNTESDVNDRPFYFADIRVDPADPNRLYRLEVAIDVSKDGGKSFKALTSFNSAHPDHHALWIDPNDPEHLIDGDDGGVFSSRDQGATWAFSGSLPIGQFYHVRYDMDVPYHVYGGLQDNGSWRGPSTVWENGDNIRNHHWQEVDFGDGFDTAPDPRDSSRGYAMSQGGALIRWDVKTGERKAIRPEPPKKEEKLRFNWNAAFAIDPFEPDTIYLGSQYVHRSTDRGETWTAISPDLTTNKAEWQKQRESGGVTLDVTGAENFTTLLAIAPSPIAKGVIWTGSDDGRIHVTRDGGAIWTSVEGNLTGVPANTWVPHIFPSPYDAGTAFAVFDDHRRANYATYVYRTADYGKSWKSLATSDLRGYALSIVEDPAEPNLLFLGTEFSLWFSLDGGGKWLPFHQGVPTVSVMDLAIQPRENDLILATHGRGLYIVDDIRPLRTLSAATLAEPLHLFPIPDAQQYRAAQPIGPRFSGSSDYAGKSRPYGALITVSLNATDLPLPDEEKERDRKEKARREKAAQGGEAAAGSDGSEGSEGSRGSGTKGASQESGATGAAGPPDEKPKATIEILDAGGKRVRSFQQEVKLGVNRFAWNLRRDPFKDPPSKRPPSPFRAGGPQVAPGSYTVKVSYGGKTAEAPLRVLGDPRREVSAADRAANEQAVQRAGALKERVSTAIERIAQTKADLKAIVERAKKRDDERKRREGAFEPAPEVKDLEKAVKDLKEKLGAVEKKLWTPEDMVGRPAPETAIDEIDEVLSSLTSSWDAPNATQLAAIERVEAQAEPLLAELEGLYDKEVPAFRAKVPARYLTLLDPLEPESGKP